MKTITQSGYYKLRQVCKLICMFTALVNCGRKFSQLLYYKKTRSALKNVPIKNFISASNLLFVIVTKYDSHRGCDAISSYGNKETIV